jgi:hypothetical protein
VVGKSPAISTLKPKRDLQIWSPVVAAGRAVELAGGRAVELAAVRALADGPELADGWAFGPLPLPASVVVSLPLALASLVVVSAFYSGSVVGAERAA